VGTTEVRLQEFLDWGRKHDGGFGGEFGIIDAFLMFAIAFCLLFARLLRGCRWHG